jgi:CRISPR-associated protein Csh1
MLTGMRTLALDFLVQNLAKPIIPENLEIWYENLRKNEPIKLFPYLVEDSEKIEKVYVLEKENDDLVYLTVQDIVTGIQEGCTADKLPFIKPVGGRSAQIGPIIKRSYNTQKKYFSPSEVTIKTTMDYFDEIITFEKPWRNYFREVLLILKCRNLRILDGEIINWESEGYTSLLSAIVDRIGAHIKTTAFITIKTSDGKFPGERPEYIKYLLSEITSEKYITKDALPQSNQTCSLCNKKNVTVFSNGLKGAGINFSNVDRVGVFPSIDIEQAWKKFGICIECADLLYIFKNHVLKKGGVKRDKIPFSAQIAGESALVIPTFLEHTEVNARIKVLQNVKSYIKDIKTNVMEQEDEILYILKDEESILNLNILWATIGQNIDKVTGMIRAVLPSRLRELSKLNIESQKWEHALFPKINLTGTEDDLNPNLSLTALKPLFKRPGGKKAKDINASRSLFQLKRRIAECIYHKTELDGKRFWDEFLITAHWYWIDEIEKGDSYRLLNEGSSKNKVFLTAAGWIKYMNWWNYYLKKAGVFQMEKAFFEPIMPELKTYFGPESGIDTPDKAYAFLLGVLYGKVIQVQAARGVNVGANALTWLKRLTLRGENLPELYCKIREKNLAYEIEGNTKVREVLSEIGRLGAQLGDKIRLNEVQTNYYLLLGQSMTETILPTQKNKLGSGKK